MSGSINPNLPVSDTQLEQYLPGPDFQSSCRIKMFDVVAVGAGLSGLQASYHPQRAGLSVAIIEARDRIGGRVCTVPIASNRGVADLGAT